MTQSGGRSVSVRLAAAVDSAPATSTASSTTSGSGRRVGSGCARSSRRAGRTRSGRRMAAQKTRSHPALPKEHVRAIDKMLGRPIAIQEAERESDLQRLALLAERVRELRYPQTNPFKTSFTKFRTALCWSKDESAGGRTALLPD